jgi:outer membrane lipoprotein-sorting protein
MMKKFIFINIVFLFLNFSISFALTGEEVVQKTFDNMRGKSSISIVKMSIHRNDWHRSVLMTIWTLGETESLFTITKPVKDAGNGTLKKGPRMWIFNPKVNRVIKLPPSMMSQSWMGSDFSNNDLAKTDSLIKDFKHELKGSIELQGKTIYRITCIPEPDAPVVWGMLKLEISEDMLLLREEFYDEDLKLVKTMANDDVREIGGKLFPCRWKMWKAGSDEEYTMLEYQTLEFTRLPKTIFSLQNLKNPKRLRK